LWLETTVSTRSTRNAQRLQVHEELREQRVANAVMRVVGVDADRIHDGDGLGAAEVAKVGGGGHEPCHDAVHARGERHPHRRVVEGLVHQQLHVLLALLSAGAAVDTHDVGQVLGLQRPHIGVVAGERLVIVLSLRPVIDLVRPAFAFGRRDTLRARVDDSSAVNRTVDDEIATQAETGVVEEPQHVVARPGGCRANLLQTLLLRLVLERLHELRADAMALAIGAHGEHLEPERWRGAAELAVQATREHESEQPLRPFRGELNVKRGLLERDAEPPLVVGMPRPPHDRRVDRDDRVEVFG